MGGGGGSAAAAAAIGPARGRAEGGRAAGLGGLGEGGGGREQRPVSGARLGEASLVAAGHGRRR